MPVKPIPDGYHSVTPYIIVKGAGEALEFYKKAFGAIELFRMPGPDGRIGHAEFRIGDSVIMMADEFPDMNYLGPLARGGPTSSILLYVPNVDEMAKHALAAGAKEVKPIMDQFYGDRSGTYSDPFGHMWTIATHTEDVPPEEMEKRAAEFAKKQCSS